MHMTYFVTIFVFSLQITVADFFLFVALTCAYCLYPFLYKIIKKKKFLTHSIMPKYKRDIKILQWKPVKVTLLKVNNQFTSTAYVGPVFSALYFSNLNPDNVNHLKP